MLDNNNEPQSGAEGSAVSNNPAEWVKEAAKPTAAAMDDQPFVPGEPGPSPAGTAGAQQQQGPQYTPPEGAKTVFEDTGDTEPQPGQQGAQPGPKPLSKGYEDKVLKGIVNGEDYFTATITAMVAGQEDIEPFRASDEDKDTLVELMEPFREWIMDKCPHWLPFLLAYGTVKTKQFAAGRSAFKTNKANRQAADDSGTMEKIHHATQQTGTRSKYTLYKDGHYTYDRNGNYLSRANPEHLKRRERPNIADLGKILAVKSNNDRDILKAAFNWGDDDFYKHGIQ